MFPAYVSNSWCNLSLLREKSTRKDLIFSTFFPPSTSAFRIASAKTVYSTRCLQEEVVWRPNFIIVERNDLRNLRDLGVLSVESLPLLSRLFFQSQASLGLLSHVKQFGFLLEECCVCQAQREPRGMDLLSCLTVVVSWTLIRCLIKNALGSISFTGVWQRQRKTSWPIPHSNLNSPSSSKGLHSHLCIRCFGALVQRENTRGKTLLGCENKRISLICILLELQRGRSHTKRGV